VNGIIQIPDPGNEPVLNYAPGSPERASLKKRLDEMLTEEVDIPAIIGGQEVRTGNTMAVVCPHDHGHSLGVCHQVTEEICAQAVQTSQEAWKDWSEMDWEARAAIFLKAADMLAGPWRDTINASTMLGQSKTAYQAEIDAAAEIVDFWKYNAHFMRDLYTEQPRSAPGIWDYVEYRPLEGFVFAITPFNFTSIGANLPTAPAIMGNVVLWKPSSTSPLSNYYLMKLLEEAGLPPGVINFVPGRGASVGNPVFDSKEFAGLHFTGSTPTFQWMWRTIAQNLEHYKSYPRIVGETGGKDFVFVHPWALRAPVGEHAGSGDGVDPRRLRIPGSEVLGRLACLHPRVDVARFARSPRSPGWRDQDGLASGFHQLYVRGHRRGCFRQHQQLRRRGEQRLEL